MLAFKFSEHNAESFGDLSYDFYAGQTRNPLEIEYPEEGVAIAKGKINIWTEEPSDPNKGIDRHTDYRAIANVTADFTYNTKTQELKVESELLNDRTGARAEWPSEMRGVINEETIGVLKNHLVPEVDRWIENEKNFRIENVKLDIDPNNLDEVTGSFDAYTDNAPDSPDPVYFSYRVDSEQLDLEGPGLRSEPAYVAQGFDKVEERIYDEVSNAIAQELEKGKIMEDRNVMSNFDPDKNAEVYVFMHSEDSVAIATRDPFVESPRALSASSFVVFDSDGCVASESPENIGMHMYELADFVGMSKDAIDNIVNEGGLESLAEEILEHAEAANISMIPVRYVDCTEYDEGTVYESGLPDVDRLGEQKIGFIYATRDDYTVDDLYNELDDYNAYISRDTYDMSVYEIVDNKINLDDTLDYGNVYGTENIGMYENTEAFLGSFDSAEQAKESLDGPVIAKAQMEFAELKNGAVRNLEHIKADHNREVGTDGPKKDKDVEIN